MLTDEAMHAHIHSTAAWLADKNVDMGRAYAFLAKHGRAWKGMARPENYSREKPKQCYANSQRYLLRKYYLGLASRREAPWFYAEGIAVHGKLKDLFLPVPHGWLVNPGGEVLDLTWEQPEHSIYFGVVFQLDAVRRHINATSSYSSLFATTMDRCNPLLASEEALATIIQPWPPDQR